MEMSATQEQMDMLLEFLEENQGFSNGIVKNFGGRREKKSQLWANITAKLNSVGGAVKTVKQWQKVWADRKYLAKKAAALHRRSADGTASPSTPPPLTETERRVIKIIGEDLDTRRTRAASEQILDDQNIDSFSDDSIHDKDLIILTKDPLVTERLQEVDSNAPEGSGFQKQRKRRFFSQSPRSDSEVESKLVHLEEKKIEELTGIRHELRELTGAVRQLIEVIKNKS